MGERDPPPGEALAVRALEGSLGRGDRAPGATIDETLTEGLALREKGVPDAKAYRIHRHLGEPCWVCGTPIAQVDFEEHTIFYCPTCQTGGRVLKDRRMSRLLR